MSAFMVAKTHVDALLTAGLVYGRSRSPLSWYFPSIDAVDETYQSGSAWGADYLRIIRERKRDLTTATANQVGAVLLAENRRSVNFRYREDDLEYPYEFTELDGRPDPVIVLSALACYRYQACEHPGWPASEAFAFCAALEQAAIRQLPGFDAAPWAIDDPRVFLRR
jgi:hypothetical protein